jgi:hypothetical protein
MRRALLLALLVAMAVPATASAKELTGFTLCGPDGCRQTGVQGFGHEDPFSGDTEAAPPDDYLEATLLIDGNGTWKMFYVPREGVLAVVDGDARIVRWMLPVPRLATELKRTARGLRAYPGPRLTAVTVGERRIEDGASSYLRLLELRGRYADPGSGSGERIRFEAAAPSPWTEEELYYFPETGVVAGAGRWVRLPSAMAANLEAGRPLDAPAPSGWARPVLAAVAAALVLVAIGLLLLRRRWGRDGLAAPAASS